MFDVVLCQSSEISDVQLESLFEAGCDDATPASCNGLTWVHFHRESHSLDKAIDSAILQVASAGLKISKIEMDVDASLGVEPCVSEVAVNLEGFVKILQQATASAILDFRQEHPTESPYAMALVLGQCGNYLGFAIATEESLLRTASRYADLGYRYQAYEWERFDNIERLAAWLRWANPDDGWLYGDFSDQSGVANSLASMVAEGAFGEAAERLEQVCTDMLAGLALEPYWGDAIDSPVIVGVTSGCDPHDFLRTATRANPYMKVRQLWKEFTLGEELDRRIPAPRRSP